MDLSQAAQPWLQRTAAVIFVALAIVALTGCKSIDPELVRAMAGDDAHVRVRVTSLYGTIEFERRMDFAPPAPPVATGTNLVTELLEALARRDSLETPQRLK